MAAACWHPFAFFALVGSSSNGLHQLLMKSNRLAAGFDFAYILDPAQNSWSCLVD